jgi:hypothetical protein
MEPDLAVFAARLVMLLTSLAVLIALAFGARALWRMGSRKAGSALPAPGVREELERLQTAVDAIAIEVERISEAQRFTVTLLSNGLAGSERVGELPRRAATPRIDTPH